ncbi:fatty acid--CoA ligase [Picrophilus oshimae]|uniref:Fatty-acyl-CoA synthase n=1 Tax=Picrophilus torridus (strain ATCC 700027 / DSM 9790 / JCM 10055 / NBRC 100828 / KAW 2/3) TaxID=1122961 RepID=A0A8G2FXB7_PICTO|nr:fatty acid--CoA ligase [Picrophilus oshimae]SMD31234.1 fatty-acyl-CoA synthase [Picrophilus oshimae DSM 9789]
MNGFDLTINNLLETAARDNGDQKIVYMGKSVTYNEFYKNALNLSRNLIRIGVRKNDVVAVIDYDSLMYMYAYYSIPMIGSILHTVNIRYPPEIIFYTMQRADDSYIMIDESFMGLIVKNRDYLNFIKGIIVNSAGHRHFDVNIPVYYFDDLLKDSDAKFEEPDENDTATLFFTSGTTGLPKGVSFTHRQLVLHSIASIAALSNEPIKYNINDVIMPLVPMFHVHAWGIPYTSIMNGLKYVLPGKYDVPRILETMATERISMSAMVPTILYMLLSDKNAKQAFQNLNLKVIIGGAALSRGLAERARAYGIDVVSGYGMSETAPILTLGVYNRKVINKSDEEKFEFRLKTGIPIPMVSLRVVNNNRDVENNGKEIGEIIVRAPWLTKGYIKDEEKTRELWKDGWLHTGDLAVVDEYGYVKIVDREKDAIKSGGEFIPSLILEDLISTISGVNEVAVVAKSDDKWGERPVAFINGNLSVEELKLKMMEFVDTGRIAKFWIPDDFIFVNEMPKTSTGKIDKKVLREKLR